MIEGGKSIGGINLINVFNFMFGGFQYLVVYVVDQLNGNEFVYGNVMYMNQLMMFNVLLIKVLLIGVSVEVGNVWVVGEKIGGGVFKQSYMFFMSLLIVFGLVYIGVVFVFGG